ncbi:MAG: hypothetical protein LBH43_12160 [Treponema sp.]|jgi:hypothetical protein|nr:hypothetical protein [Treponema sp.]
MRKSKILVVGIIGLLLAAGLVMAGCDTPGCKGSGECTITFGQGSSGLFIDTDAPRSSCGTETSGDTSGCKVADSQSSNSYVADKARKYGTLNCDC